MHSFNLSIKRFNEFAAEYAARFMDIDSYRKHFDIFCDLIGKESPEILELACGPGNVTRYLKEKFPKSKITAIDLAPRMLEIAKQNVPDVDFRLMDVREVKSLDKKFDAVMCSFCLPFLSKQDAAKLISNCSEILEKDGVIYISTMEGDESDAGFETTSFSGNAEIYFNYHRLRDLEDALIANKFQVNYNIRQDYNDSKGGVLIDIILIARKNIP